MSDPACAGRDLGWHLDMASFWTQTGWGVQAEEGGQCSLVGQGDGPWNSLAHNVRTEVNELAVNLCLEKEYIHMP